MSIHFILSEVSRMDAQNFLRCTQILLDCLVYWCYCHMTWPCDVIAVFHLLDIGYQYSYLQSSLQVRGCYIFIAPLTLIASGLYNCLSYDLHLLIPIPNFVLIYRYQHVSQQNYDHVYMPWAMPRNHQPTLSKLAIYSEFWHIFRHTTVVCLRVHSR